MASRFGGYLYDDPIRELKALKWEGLVLEYEEQFDELLNRVDLLEDYATSCFLSGLKAEIQLVVRMFMLRTLQFVRMLAKLEEAKILTQQKKGMIKTGFNPNL